jgi:short-subunit dehydrogenase
MAMNLIIGGTHGLGAEIAQALQESGQETFVVGRSYSVQEHGAGRVLDLAKPKAVREFAVEMGEMDLKGFYFVAGYGYKGDFSEQSAEDIERLLQVDLTSALVLGSAAWKVMLKQEKPSNFVIISSTTGHRARADEAVYAAAKHGLTGFARSLGQESERLKTKIRVLHAAPGGMKTPFWDGARPESYDAFLDPAKVAQRILSDVRDQSTAFKEDIIERNRP